MLNDKSAALWKTFLSEFPNAVSFDVYWREHLQTEMDRFRTSEAETAGAMLRWAMAARDRYRGRGSRLDMLIEDPLILASVLINEPAKLWAKMIGWNQVAREHLQEMKDRQ